MKEKLTQIELFEKLKGLRRDLLNLRIQGSAQPLPNPLKKREVRREIARLLTMLHQAKKEKKVEER